MIDANAHELCFMSIADLAMKIARKDVSPVEITEAVLRRIEKYDELMRVYITVTSVQAREQARQAEAEIRSGCYRGPLHGIPISLKDNIATRGIRTSCGSLVDSDWIPGDDATIYARLRSAGAILVGKANLFEYAFSMHPEFPQPLNPWHTDRSSLGSSSGSAVGVAVGMAHGSIGTDTGGSGRAPASANGVVGFKATYGRVSRAGIVPLSFSLDHATIMTRRVADCALMLNAVSGFDSRDENSVNLPVPDFHDGLDQGIAGLRVGIARGYSIQDVDSDTVEAMRNAVEQFEQLGANIDEVRLPFIEQSFAVHTAIMNPEAADIHFDRFRQSSDRFGDSAVMRLDLGNVILATDYVRAQRVRKLMRDKFRELFREFDLIIGPAMPVRVGSAGSWSVVVDGHERDIRSIGPEYTGIYNLVGIPALVIPAGFSDEGTPIGLQIAGRWWNEELVLRTGYAFEQATTWHQPRPPLPG